MTTETKTNKVAIKTPKQALDRLRIEFFSKHRSKVNLPLETKVFYPILKTTIREFEKFLGLPELSTFIVAAYRNNEFKEFKFPELALVEGKPHFVVNNVAYPANKFLTSDSKYTIQVEGKPEDKNCVARLSHPDNPLKQLHVRLYSSTETAVDDCLAEDREELAGYLLEYVFSSAVLDEGVHVVSDWGKDKFNYMVIENRKYFCSEIQLEQFAKRRAEGKPTNYCVEIVTVKHPETGEETKYRNRWVEGYKKAKYAKSLFKQYRPEIPETKEILQELGRVVFEKPLVFDVLGLEDGITKQKSNKGDGALVDVKCKFIKVRTQEDGREHMLVARGFLEKAVTSGKFEVKTFDGFTLTVRGVKFYSGYAFDVVWDVPLDSNTIDNDEVLSQMAAAFPGIAI